jgi:hypothetical protein
MAEARGLRGACGYDFEPPMAEEVEAMARLAGGSLPSAAFERWVRARAPYSEALAALVGINAGLDAAPDGALDRFVEEAGQDRDEAHDEEELAAPAP